MVLKSLESLTIKNGVLSLGFPISESEFKELAVKLRAALLNRKIPFYKPIACLFSGTSSIMSVTSVDKAISKTYLGMLPEFTHCICMPPDNIDTLHSLWVKRRRNKDDGPVDKIVWARSLGNNNLVYVRSIDDGDVYFSDCVYVQDTDTAGGNRKYIRPLLRDCEPIVSINGNGAFIDLHMVLGVSCGKTSCADVIKTIGTISNRYLQIEQIYGLEEYLSIVPYKEGDSTIKFTYKRDIDEEVLMEIFRRFASRLLNHYETSMEQAGTPAFVFCRRDVAYISEMWED